MDSTTLKDILDKHSKWYHGQPGGVRANLSGADLRGAYLRSADLTGADLTGAYLSGADLTGAYLRSADLRSADLSGADLTSADLRSADLSGAVLDERTTLPNGVKWKDYLDELLPELLTVRGKALSDVLNQTVFACHSWMNCPMHVAFDAERLENVPALYRREAGLFIDLFDGKLLTLDLLMSIPEIKDALETESLMG